MIKFNILDFDVSRDIICCKTIEEYNQLMIIFNYNGLKWGCGDSYLKDIRWNYEEDGTGYSLRGTWAGIKYYKNDRYYNLIPFNEFLTKITMKNFKNTMAVTGDVHLLKALLEKSKEIGWTFQDNSNDNPNYLFFNSKEGDVWWSNSVVGYAIYNLPSDWDNVISLLEEQEQESFKEDDYVVCLPGFNTSDSGQYRGGSGYKENKIFKIKRVSNGILWDYNDNGVWSQAVRLATPPEIVDYRTIKIGSYTSQFKDNKVYFGCQSFDINELSILYKLLNEPINAKISIEDTPINKDLIIKLKNSLENEQTK